MKPLPILALAAVALAGCGEVETTRVGNATTASGPTGRIAFKRHSGADLSTASIFTVGADGKGARRVTDAGPGVVDSGPDWSPDGSRLVFERVGVPWAIFTVRPDGSGLRRVTPACSASGPDIETKCEDASSPSFHPDGRRVVYTRATGKVRTIGGESWIAHSDIVMRRVDGADPRVLIRSRPYSGDTSGAKFSPDGSRLLFVRQNSPLSAPAGGRAIFVADADGRHPQQITPWALDAGDDPTWAPDGKLILFRSHVGGAQQSQLHVVRPDGGGLRRLTNFETGTEVLSSSFSPDGDWITFAKDGQGGQPDIFVMRANGTQIRAITTTPVWESTPDWGVDH